MLKFITSFQISHRLLLAFLLASLVPGIVISLLGITFLREQNARSRAIQINTNASKLGSTVNSYLLTMNVTLNATYERQYEMNHSNTDTQLQESISMAQSNEHNFELALQRFQQQYQLTSSPTMRDVYSVLINNESKTTLPREQQDILTEVNTLWQEYKSSQDSAEGAITKKAPPEEVHILLLKANDDYVQLANAWARVMVITQQINDSIALGNPLQINPFVLATLINFLSTILVITLIGYIVYRTITRPLRQLEAVMKRVAQGETYARATLEGRDEICQVARALNAMLNVMLNAIRETQIQRNMLQGQVEKLLCEVSGVEEGDLRVQAEVTSDAVGVIADAFNYMIDELGGLVVRVKDVASEFEQSTALMLRRMKQLVDTGTKDIEHIGKGRTQIEQVISSSRQIVERDGDLYEIARQARQDAHSGDESLFRVTASLSHIADNMKSTELKARALGERSREVGAIVAVISDLAHQTNRMGLDAAIQAAMAGDNSTGFGALAADIRRLAERAREEASTAGLIVREVRNGIETVAATMKDTQRNTTTSLQLTQEARTALEAVFAAVERQAQEIEQINQIARQQVKSSNTVLTIIQQVATSTQHRGGSMQETAQSIERLGQLIEQLRASVTVFKLREGPSFYTPRTNFPAFDMQDMNLEDPPLTVSGVFRRMNSLAPVIKTRDGWYHPSSAFTPMPQNDLFTFTPLPEDSHMQASRKRAGVTRNDLSRPTQSGERNNR